MKRLAIFLLALGMASTAYAQDPPICTDRPAKANSVCTVAPGRLQLETSAAGWGLTKSSGNRSELLTLASSIGKIGLSERSDLQIGFTPLAQITGSGGGTRDRVSGFGDVLVRYKHRLTAKDAPVQAALIPFIKLPTARRGLGNGQVEGGIAVPISIALGKPATLILGPELNLLADSDGRGRHLALVNLVNVSVPVASRWTAAAEVWTNLNFDPAGTVKQASADAALAYAVTRDLQLDIGANVGLTAATPDLELYAGISIRF